MMRIIIKDWENSDPITNAIKANEAGNEVYLLHKVNDPMYDAATWTRLRLCKSEIFVVSVASRKQEIDIDSPAMNKLIDQYREFRKRENEIATKTREWAKQVQPKSYKEERYRESDLSEHDIDEFLKDLYNPDNIEGHT